MNVTINRQKLGLEDLLIGSGTETQIRSGKEVEITKLNVDALPYGDQGSTFREIVTEMAGARDEAVQAAIETGNDLSAIQAIEQNVIILEGQASNSKDAAALSEQNAALSAQEALNYEQAAAAILDTFDDRYLGSFATAPLVDNDGDTLQDGALYFDSTIKALHVYDLATTTWISLPVTSLSSMTDIVLNSLTTGQYLQWNGSTWVNVDLEIYTTMEDLTDTLFTNKTTGDLVYFDGTNWVNVNIFTQEHEWTQIQKFASIQLTGGDSTQGIMSWNTDERTIDLTLNGVTLQLGQEQLIGVRNNSGSLIANKTVCMYTGTIGNSGKIEVEPCDAQSEDMLVGIATEDIPNGEDGFITTFGKLRGVDTSAWNEGDILYVASGGQLTNVEPLGVKIPVAVVISSSVAGTLFVRISNFDQNKYAIKTEVNNALDLKANSSDIYTKTELNNGQLDSRYYTESEADALFEPADSTILKDADIGVTVQGYDADTAKLDEAQTFTAPQRGTITVDNDGNFDLNVTNNFSCTPTALFTLTFTNISAGQSGQILLDNTGGYVITADTNTKVDANFLSTISTAGVYVLGYFSNGTNVYVYNSGAMV
jgi:hypothetical protein